jgi:membrane protease subunit HflK
MAETTEIKKRVQGLSRGAVLLVLCCVLLAVLIDFLCTGIWTIQENQQGVVLRLGAFHRKVYPGLVFTLPWPLEEMIKVNTKETLKMPVGFRFMQGADPTPSMAAESEWLTGDMNVIVVEMIIHYNVSDPYNYLFSVGPVYADFLIRKCAESALTEIIGIMSVDAILTTEQQRIGWETRARAQELLDRFGAGVTIARASFQNIAPPEEVIDSFNEVISAGQDRDTAEQEADGYRRDLLPKARAQADRIVQQALVYQSKVLSEARGRAERFRSIYEEYKHAPEITETRLFLETVGMVLVRPQKIIVNPNEDGKSEVRVIR